ncbi:NAD-glutamate dehydrogenase [Nakamurella sp. YIM 132087]|uniref:NAD-glutamate dehydrogenase n=1 Tax=Nakamurella alba TaxID=2665158 RepID=A0A7K1FH59_9ACTN|nr:NAD-glutamate dehydrogenase [Nakamurella alba]MTD13467.1 NAD-glutamate dehydrogenase [Nakamurella alba]
MTQTRNDAGSSTDGSTEGDGAGQSASAAPKSSTAEAARRRPDLARLIEVYYRHVPAEDRPREPQDVLAVVEGHRRLAARRLPGEARIRIHNPPAAVPDRTEEETAHPTGWSATSTVIDIVNDDMPYLVDSVIGALTAAGVRVHRVLHPILSVRRDTDGSLLEVTGEARRPSNGFTAMTSGLRPGAPVPTVPLRESWVHVLIDRLSDAERAEAIEAELVDVLAAVRAVVQDTPTIIGAATMAAAELRNSPSPRPVQEVSEAGDLLYWLTAGNLTFLGYRLVEAGEEVPGSGLGMLREESPYAEAVIRDEVKAGPEAGHLVLTQLSQGAPINREIPPFAITVRTLGADGSVHREHHFYGVLTPRALTAEISATPVLRRIAERVLAALDAAPDTYTGQRAMDLLSVYPRAELFWADPDLLLTAVSGVLQLSSRRRLRAFLQPDPYGRFVSVLVYLPRDRWTTAARLAMQQVLLDVLHGTGIRYTARIGESLLAFVHFTVTVEPDRAVHLDEAGLADLHRKLRSTIRTWEDRLVAAVVGGGPAGGDEELDTAGALNRYAEAFDESYKEDYSVDEAVTDLERLDALTGPDDLALQFSVREGGDRAPDERRLKLYVAGARVTLSRALPVLQSLGAEVIDEKPYEVRRSDGTKARIYDFGLRFDAAKLPVGDQIGVVRARLSDAFIAAWQNRAEVDGFNNLVLAAGLDWHQVAVFRAYARYLRQIGTPWTQGYLEQVLAGYPEIATDLAELFAIRFDPDRFADDDGNATAGPQRLAAASEVTDRITAALDAVTSLDADRIMRQFLALITATARTNAFRVGEDGGPRTCLTFKLLPQLIPGVPKPVPAFEIWVYSPRIEGVHLRFGPVARGGLRWSDRPEDFRTEILGLVKAQEVKNAVIVPVGAKGGFVLKQAPATTGDPAADREALQAEGVACYRQFIAGLLNLTDNRVGGAIVPPERTVRHDADDPYLVVAADKGTATFSDIANGVAADYGFWLGDAFASGGSVGYDHKAMGITARGAWESVKHHFRELGINTQEQDFTVVGVGDMSGDVFGNGVLLSEHIRLVAAFDHRHVFVDPTPDAGTSYAERRRLFDLPRSSWADYDTSLISAGGGVFPRTAKSIPITGEMRAALGIEDDVTSLAPVDLIRRVLLAPVQLLWNGGIGTYVKASTEPQTAAGDKSNDAVRVNGGELRVQVVGEGGNLGVTQLGRIEFARAGGRINTDAIDNSAGVDTSDHEVNIKIALQPALASGQLGMEERDELLASMTDEVAHLVLADNTAQNRVLGVSRHHAVPMLSVHARLIDSLVAAGRLDRALEYLPSRAQIEARTAAGESLTSPELSVLLAYVKSALSEAVLASDLPDDPAFAGDISDYFPTAMRGGDEAAAIEAHPLAREIVTTMTVNEVVNGAGITYAFRLGEEIAADPTDAVRAYRVVTEVFGLRELWRDIAAEDNRIPASSQDTLFLEVRRLLDRAARWLLANRPRPLDVPAEIDRYRDAVAELAPKMPRLVRGVEHENVRAEAAKLVALDAPADLANRIAYSLYTYSALDIADVARDSGRDLVRTAELYYELSARMDFDQLLSAVTALQRGDRWHALARQALRDDLYRSMRLLTADVLTATPDDADTLERIREWEVRKAGALARARSTLGQIAAGSAGDLAALSVAASEVRTLIG